MKTDHEALPTPPSVEARADVRGATWHPLDENGAAELRVNGKRITSFPSYSSAKEASERINAALESAPAEPGQIDVERAQRAVERAQGGKMMRRRIAEPGRKANPDIEGHLISVADASVRADGSDIPLGETCRGAAREIERLRRERDGALRSLMTACMARDAFEAEILGCYDELAALKAETDARVKAAVEAEETFENIRLILIKHLDEPERSAFWLAVKGRDAARASQADLGQEVGRG